MESGLGCCKVSSTDGFLCRRLELERGWSRVRTIRLALCSYQGQEALKAAAVAIVTMLAISMCGCARLHGPGSGQNATVTLNDGSTFSGTITSSSTSSISLRGANGESRVIPTSQVASVEYGHASAAQPPADRPAN